VGGVLHLAGLLCLVAGFALIAAFAYGIWSGVSDQQRHTAGWKRVLAAAPPPEAPAAVPPVNLMQPVDGVDFAIRVPKLGYYSAVKEGVDAAVLYSGPGHYLETRWPGQDGMVGVAAHNVYWINFPGLRNGDEVQIETRYGTFKYGVTGTRIVNPDDRTILVQGPGRHLILTTCWPLWAGSFATQRYIIFTDQTYPVPPPDAKPGS